MVVDLAMLVLARSLLRACSPIRAHALLLRVGSWLPPIRSPEEARAALQAISKHGTCLSRSLAVAARAPAADVAIGVTPNKKASIFAHAWIEVDGAPLNPGDVVGSVIATLRGRQSASKAGAGKPGTSKPQ
jgi:hypothetical protein